MFSILSGFPGSRVPVFFLLEGLEFIDSRIRGFHGMHYFWLVGFLFLLAGIFNSRIGSILGWELWVAVGLACKLVVVEPGRISIVYCSWVLHVDRSLYSSRPLYPSYHDAE